MTDAQNYVSFAKSTKNYPCCLAESNLLYKGQNRRVTVKSDCCGESAMVYEYSCCCIKMSYHASGCCVKQTVWQSIGCVQVKTNQFGSECCGVDCCCPCLTVFYHLYMLPELLATCLPSCYCKSCCRFCQCCFCCVKVYEDDEKFMINICVRNSDELAKTNMILKAQVMI